MKILLILLAAGLLMGCATRPAATPAPSLSVPIAKVITVREKVAVTKAKVEKIEAPEARAVEQDLTDIDLDLGAVVLQLEKKQTEVNELNQKKAEAEEAAYVWRKKEEYAVAALWKTRAWLAGVVLSVVAFFVLRQYFPFLKFL